MKEIKEQEMAERFVIYGETGVGKTLSCLLSMPEPILCIYTEPRNPYLTLQAVNKKVDVKFIMPENFNDFFEFLAEETSKNNWDYNSVLIDSFSYLMNSILASDIEKETYESGTWQKGLDRPLINQTRRDEAGYGSSARWMMRVSNLLGKYSQAGVVVCCVAQLQENPKWNQTLYASPNFEGRMFNLNFSAYFDMIGLVESRTDKEGNIVYPPKVSFEGEGFVAKWTGRKPRDKNGNIRPAIFPLDIQKILAVHRRTGKGGDKDVER
jgi:hypothetical protein